MQWVQILSKLKDDLDVKHMQLLEDDGQYHHDRNPYTLLSEVLNLAELFKLSPFAWSTQKFFGQQ